MGQKVNPHGARVGVIFNWSTRWYAEQEGFRRTTSLRTYKPPRNAQEEHTTPPVSAMIDIERSANRVTINIFTAKPGMVIGRGGAGIEALKKDIEAFLGQSRQHQHHGDQGCPTPTPSSWPRTSPSSWRSASPSAAP